MLRYLLDPEDRYRVFSDPEEERRYHRDRASRQELSWCRNQEEIRQSHMSRYRQERTKAYWDRRQELERAQERAQREEAAVRAAMASDGPSGGEAAEELPAYQGRPSWLDHMYQRATERAQRSMQTDTQRPPSQQGISDEDRKQENLYRPTNNTECPPYQTDSYQQSLFQTNNSYRQGSRPAQPGMPRAPAFREGWDQPPIPGLSRPPIYNTSEREQSEQAWRR